MNLDSIKIENCNTVLQDVVDVFKHIITNLIKASVITLRRVIFSKNEDYSLSNVW